MEDNWYGRPLEDIYRLSAYEHEFDHVENIKPGERHTVLFEYPFGDSVIPKPFARSEQNHEDKDYVRLPFYPSSRIQIKDEEGEVTQETLWVRVLFALESKDFDSSWDLEDAIKSYNNKVGTFYSLHEYFSNNGEASTYFFKVLLKRIISLALSLPELIKTGIPLLRQGRNQSISLSQQQIACLLANAFLCTFPTRRYNEQFCPEINFNRLFESRGSQVLAKIECLINYFQRVCVEPPTGVLTFSRRSVKSNNFPNWSAIPEPLSNTALHITPVGTIEDNGIGLLQVDFANKFIGGGVLGGGCVQEDIRFVICPELIVSRLFTEFLKDNEALLMVGAEQFSTYTGYGHSFKFSKKHRDDIPIDKKNRRRLTHIIAIDAYHFSNSSRQYEPRFIKRELNKAFVGFIHSIDSPPPGVATGNWGCGAFGGDSKLKALIQLMACTITSRPLLYFTFGDRKLSEDIYEMYTFLVTNNINVQQLFNYLCEYKENAKQDENLYAFIKRRHEEKKTTFLNSLCNGKHEENTKSLETESDKKELSLTEIELELLEDEMQHPCSISSSTDLETCYGENSLKKDMDGLKITIELNFKDLKLSDQKDRVRSIKVNANNDLLQSTSKSAKTESEKTDKNMASTSSKPNKNLRQTRIDEYPMVRSYQRDFH